MRRQLKKSIVGIFLVLGMLSGMVPGTLVAEGLLPILNGLVLSAQGDVSEPDSGSETQLRHQVIVPKANDIEHVHNSVGWTCTQECSIPEHTHSVDAGCYVKGDDLVCGYHDHEAACYNDGGELICGKKAMEWHMHTLDNGCYSLTCTNDAADHVHTQEDCYTLTCTQQENEGHEHSDLCTCTLTCDKQEHTHGDGTDCEKDWNCTTDYVLLTVEYYIAVDGEEVRSSHTYQALLTNGDNYRAPIDDLRKDGYKIDVVKRYTAGAEDSPEEVSVTEGDSKYYVSGTAEKDTKIIVYYAYQDDYAPYQVDYWGYNQAGQNPELLYSYIGLGQKDSQISASQDEANSGVISIAVNDLLKNLYDILGDSSGLGDSGATFIEKLKKAVNAKYLTGDEAKDDALYHDITPLLETVAGVTENDDIAAKKAKLNELTRVEIKRYVAEKIVKVYGFDQESAQIWDAKLTVTADEMAVRNLYYAPKKPQTVLFVTGIPNASVFGIPQTPIAPDPDPDNVGLNYEFKLNTNYITCLPTVSLDGYVDNVYAKHQSYVFVGWVTGEDMQAITDYTPANASGKYKDITIYTATGDGTGAGAALIPAGVKTQPLADMLPDMPDGGATYYGVWAPFGSPYTVQIWFESEKGDNTYIESHSLDIQRFAKIGQTVTFNAFDEQRAKEQQVIDAANAAAGAMFADAVTFSDPESDTVDSYYTYADYQKSPFFGFDFLECAVCAGDPSQCGSAGCTCGMQRKTNGDGTEGDATAVRACNYQKVTIGEDGTTVLNLYYTREMWEIAVTPGVEMWTTDCLHRMNEYCIHTYWVGGEEQDVIKASMEANQDSAVVIRGKYGTPVDDQYKNGIGWDNAGSAWQGLIGEDHKSRTIPAGTKILLANGSDAFQTDGSYVYPQDTETYLGGDTVGIVPDPADWVLPYHCLSTIEPEMFTNRTAKPKDESDLSKGYTTILDKVSMWEDQRFGGESSYDLLTDKKTYGTHRLNLYPYYHADSSEDSALTKHTFKVNYYLQALPHEAAGAPYVYKTSNNDEIKFVKDVKAGEDSTVTLETPASLLFYNAETPDGFIPLMWRTSPKRFTNFQGSGVLDAASRYPRPQIIFTGRNSATAYQVPSASLTINYRHATYGYHNVSFNDENKLIVNGNTVFRSDWRQWYTSGRPTQDSAAVARMDPGSYWVTDWVRAGTPNKGQINTANAVKLDGSLTGANGLYALMAKANAGNEDAITLLNQLEASTCVGAFYPNGESEKLYYHRSNPAVYRYAAAGLFSSEVSMANSENAIAFARKQYTITYNTCFLNDDGDVVRDENGIVMQKLHTTQYTMDDSGVITDKGDVVYCDQPLGYDPEKGSDLADFDTYYNNYYDAYFAVDSSKNVMDPTAFTFKGYGNASGESLSGGYGRWYLDPDGTIPFNEENLQKMPAGNIDVYYRYNDFRYQIFFVDEISGKDEEPIDAVLNGMEMTLNSVINHQIVMANTAAESFPAPSDPNLYFAGWFYDEEGTNPYDFSMEINEDVVVYAVWKPKVPTEYKIRHVLVDANGSEIRELVESEWQPSYVGNTIDANALSSAYYEDGMYFKVDDYSQSMVLEAQDDAKTKNILTFYYTYAGMRYIIEYKDIHSGVDILPSETFATKLSAVTVGMTEIHGWDYKGYSVDHGEMVPEKTHVTVNVTAAGVTVTFWYERIPVHDEIMALKLVDGVLARGTWFHYELVNEAGEVVRTAQSVNGVILFESLGLDTVGTYRYKLREVDESDQYRFTYDDTVYDVVVEVTQPEITEPLVCKITFYKNGELYEGVDEYAQPIFENHRLPAEVQLKADKYLDGNLMTGEGFNFELYGGEGILACGNHIHNAGCYDLQLICGHEEEPPTEDDPSSGHTHTNACYTKVLVCGVDENPDHMTHSQTCYIAPDVLIEEETSKNGLITFDEMSFEKTGVYVYTIRERNDGGTEYLYDEAVYRVAIEVFINDKYELDRTITITRDGEPADGIRFDNVSIIPVDLPLSGEKYIDGELMTGEGFTFLLNGGEGILDCGHHIHTEACYEMQLTCGHEEGGEEPPADGEEPGEDDPPADEHVHTDACYEKVLVCGKDEDPDHTEHDQSCYSAPDTLIAERSAKDGIFAFDTPTYNQPGLYVYEIRERNEGSISYYYDDSVYRIAIEIYFENKVLCKSVTVTRNGEPVDKIRFDNVHIEPVEVPLKAQKYIDGNLMTGEGFTFLLYGGEGVFDCDRHIHTGDCYEMQPTCGLEETEDHEHTDDCFENVLVCGKEEDPEHTEHDQSCYSSPNTLLEEKTAVDGIVNFNTLSFDRPGIYVYQMYERNDGSISYHYDDAVYRIAVEVYPNEGHKLEKRVTITRNGEPVDDIRFDNVLVTPVEVPLKAEKYIDGNLMTGEGFAFLLQGGEGVFTCGYHVHQDDCYELQLTCGYEEGEEVPKEGDVPEDGDAPTEKHKHSDACYEKALVCGKKENPDHPAHDQTCYHAPDMIIEEASAVDGSVVFKPLSYNQPGIYIYHIFERNDGDSVYRYDESVYRVAVEIFANEQHKLEKRVTITRSGEVVDTIRFDNETIPPDEPITPPDEPVTPPDEPITPPDKPVTPPDEPVTPPDEPVAPPKDNTPTTDSITLYMYGILLLILEAGFVSFVIFRKKTQKR